MIARIADALVTFKARMVLPPAKFELFQRGHDVSYEKVREVPLVVLPGAFFMRTVHHYWWEEPAPVDSTPPTLSTEERAQLRALRDASRSGLRKTVVKALLSVYIWLVREVRARHRMT